jgi:competence protein ComEC
MPLVALGVFAYIAGLLAGFGGCATIACLCGLACAALAAMRRHLVVGAVGVTIAAGALVAAESDFVGARCVSMHGRARVHEILIADDVAPGSFARGHTTRCPAPIGIVSGNATAPAGSTILASGVLTPSPRGLVLQRATVRVVRGPGWRERWRARATTAVDRVFPADAPLARALLVADTRSISPEVRDRYAAAGLAHMLSVSGLHVGIIALALDALFQLLRLPSRAATIASIAVVGVYVALIGAPDPSVRSAVMLAAMGASRLAQRPTSPWALLALGAAAPLLSPRAATDIGYQLSVAGVAALVAAGSLVRRVLPSRVRGWRRTLAAGLVTSTVATIVSAPLVAWTFGRISVVGPVTNLAAAPLMTIAQPMLFLGMLLAPLHWVAALIGDAAHPLLAGFDLIASTGASIPGAWVEVTPTMTTAVLAGIASAALIAACVARHPGMPIIVGAGALAIIVWGGMAPTGSGLAELHMLDVGQGDAIALRTPNGRWVLFDAGRSWRGGDAGRSVILPYLARRRGSLDAFVLSHPHTDHVGGASTIVRDLRPRRYYDAAFAGTAEAYRQSLLSARDAGTAWQRVVPGDSLVIDGVVVAFLAPDSTWTAGLRDPNLASTVVRVRVGSVRFLLVGDAEREEEEWLLEHAGKTLAADVLKVGHHGSSTSSGANFLDAVRPRIALVSVGANNSYGHPSQAVLETLTERGAQVLRTDQLGTVVVRTDGHRLLVEARGETWEIPPSPP